MGGHLVHCPRGCGFFHLHGVRRPWHRRTPVSKEPHNLKIFSMTWTLPKHDLSITYPELKYKYMNRNLIYIYNIASHFCLFCIPVKQHNSRGHHVADIAKDSLPRFLVQDPRFRRLADWLRFHQVVAWKHFARHVSVHISSNTYQYLYNVRTSHIHYVPLRFEWFWPFLVEAHFKTLCFSYMN